MIVKIFFRRKQYSGLPTKNLNHNWHFIFRQVIIILAMIEAIYEIEECVATLNYLNLPEMFLFFPCRC